MALSNELISNFVKAVNSSSKEETTKTFNATVTAIGDNPTVRLDGSELNTDVVTVSDLKVGDRVTVTIENHIATVTGNLTNNSIGKDTTLTSSVTGITSTVEDMVSNSAHITITEDGVVIDNATIDQAKVNNLEVNYAHIKEGVIDNATIDQANVNNLEANYAKLQNGYIDSGVIADASIADAKISDVSANKLTAGTIDASKITVTNLNATNITTGSLTVGGLKLNLTEDTAEIDGSDIVDGTVTLSGLATEVKDAIDGAIESWTSDAVPTLQNYPASNWKTDAEKKKHVGDVCYVENAAESTDGYCYRFSQASDGTFSWNLIKDSDVTKALADLKTAQGDISNIKTFDETVSSFMTNTDTELSSVKSRTTTIETTYSTKTYAEEQASAAESSAVSSSKTYTDTATKDMATTSDVSTAETNAKNYADGVASTAETNAKGYADDVAGTAETNAKAYTDTAVSTKVETSVFNEVKQTVDENSASITTLSDRVDKKADGSTVETLSTTVNEVKQTADTNTSNISSLTTTVDGQGTRISTAETNITQNSKEIETKVSSSDYTGKYIVESLINQSADTIQISAKHVNLTGYITATDLSGEGSTTINGSNITSGTIDASKVTVKNIDADNITSGTIDASKVTVKNIDADNITSGTIDAEKVTVSNLNADNITSGTIDAEKVTVSNLNADNITSGTIDASKVTVTNLNADNITTGKIQDNGTNKNSWDLDTGEFILKNGSINISTSDASTDKIELLYESSDIYYRTYLSPTRMYMQTYDNDGSDTIDSKMTLKASYIRFEPNEDTGEPGGGKISINKNSIRGYDYTGVTEFEIDSQDGNASFSGDVEVGGALDCIDLNVSNSMTVPDTGWTTLSSSSYVKYRKIFGFIVMVAIVDYPGPNVTWTTKRIATLPTGYRPNTCKCFLTTSSIGYYGNPDGCSICIDTDGKIYIGARDTAITETVNAYGVFICK